MKNTIILFLFLLTTVASQAQEDKYKNEQNKAATFELEVDFRNENVRPITSMTKDSLSPFIEATARINNGDLNIDYKFITEKKKKKSLYTLKIESIQHLSDSTFYDLRQEYIYGQVLSPIYLNNKSKTITLSNPPNNENYKHLDGKIRIEMAASLKELKNRRAICDSLKFRFTTHVLPSLAGAIVGGGVWLCGYNKFQKKSQSIYNDQYLVQIEADQAEPFYQEAVDLRNKYKNRRAIGITIISASALAFIIRSTDYLAKKNSCIESDFSISVVPYYEDSIVGHAGLTFNYQF